MNTYKEIDKDTTILYVHKKDGEVIEVLVDTDDVCRIKKHNWYTVNYTTANSLYVCTTIYYGIIDGKINNTVKLLHSFIMDVDKGTILDHVDTDTLNNKKCNLRLSSIKQNSQNRRGKNINNTSGYRNVSWSNRESKWLVQVQVDGKNKCLGKFENVDEAGKFANDMRHKYYGKYAGKK